MQSLADLQRAFCDALRSPHTPPAELLGELLDDGLALQRFNVYRNNFIVLNGDALADMFPVVKRLVGDSAFRMLATRYVRRHPPPERSLLLYGDGFPGFLGTIPELEAHPYLPDVARLEYAWTAAYHAPDADALGRETVAGIGADEWPGLRLVPHPSMHCIRSDFPAWRIWAAHQTEDSEGVISLEDGPSRVIVIRPGVQVQTREVDAGTWVLLERLQAGDTLESAYVAAARANAGFDLPAFFSRHLLDGTFIAIEKPDA